MIGLVIAGNVFAQSKLTCEILGKTWVADEVEVLNSDAYINDMQKSMNLPSMPNAGQPSVMVTGRNTDDENQPTEIRFSIDIKSLKGKKITASEPVKVDMINFTYLPNSDNPNQPFTQSDTRVRITITRYDESERIIEGEIEEVKLKKYTIAGAMISGLLNKKTMAKDIKFEVKY